MPEAATQVEPLWVRTARALELRTPPMPLPEFWTEVARVGWGTRFREPRALGQELCRTLSPERLVAMRLRVRDLEARLAGGIERWALQQEEHIDLPGELQRELREHIVGLGEAMYTSAVQGPWRAKHLADRDDYLEGFGRGFDEALRRYPADLLELLLAR